MEEISMKHNYFRRMYEPVDMLHNGESLRYYVPKKGEFRVYMSSNDMLDLNNVQLTQIKSKTIVEKIKKLNGE